MSLINPTLEEKIASQKQGIKELVDLRKWCEKSLVISIIVYKGQLRALRNRGKNGL